ncbi:10122_t:CDS:2, partial [Ambispora leptoticha]
VACRDVKLHLRIPETTLNVTISEVLSNYTNIINDNKLAAEVNICDLYAGEKKDILFTVKIQATDKNKGKSTEKDIDLEKADLKTIKADVSYFDVHKGLQANNLESPAALQIFHISHEANLLENSPNSQEIELHHEESPEFYKALIDDLSKIVSQLDEQTYKFGGGKAYTLQQEMAHGKQRCWGSRTAAESGYQAKNVSKFAKI